MRAFILSGELIRTQVFVGNDKPAPFTSGPGHRVVDLWRRLKGDGSMRHLKTGIGMESTEYCALEELTPEDFRLLLALWVWKLRQPKYTDDKSSGRKPRVRLKL